jgi:hypothetical protein
MTLVPLAPSPASYPAEAVAHHAEAAAAAGAPGATSVSPARTTALGTLLGSHVLRDGELILLILKPSLWFIVFNSLAFAIITGFLAVLAATIDHHMRDQLYLETALFFITGSLMWSVLQWMGRIYILTDQRVLRITGVFSVEIFDCPLRKVVRARMISTSREKLVGVGSIEIIPAEETMPSAVWQTIARPKEILERLRAAIARAKQSGPGAT